MTELTATFKPVDDETWEAACKLTACLAKGFGSGGTCYYYTKEGKRLHTLHDVVDCILTGGNPIAIHRDVKYKSKSLSDIAKIRKIKAQESPLLVELIYSDIRTK